MLKKVNQLRLDKEFDQVFKKGRSSYVEILGIKAFFTKAEESRLGILVSNKVSKKAVERNKIKRQIREILRLKLAKIKSGYDIIIITLPSILGKNYKEIELAIDSALDKIKILK
ncbi:MAG: ribonuclease P protein component [Patescibacteria group bacterium]